MSDKILVFGGNGFIGSAVCREAVERGHRVVSVSRTGRPAYDHAAWIEKVEWVEGNALYPETWREHLDGCIAVIHAAGILREKPKEGRTFERLNGDSVATVAWEAEQAGVERFVMLSVEAKPLFVSSRFLAAKREGEAALHRGNLRSIILRPMFVYGPERPATLPVGGLLKASGRLPFTPPATRVEDVAAVAVQAATTLDYDGVISPKNIAYLADESGAAAPRTNHIPLRKLAPYLAGSAMAGILMGLGWTLAGDR